MIAENMVLYQDLYLIPRALIRVIFIIVNNIYCIPTYAIWMFTLWPIKILYPDIYWRIEGLFFHWLLSMVAMWSYTAGYEIVEDGDDITPCLNERTLVIANHQSTADVPLLMATFNAKPNILPNLMWIMDRLFKYTNFGIVSVLHEDFFIVSGKNNRDESIIALRKHLHESYIPRKRLWMVLFPEGGFLRKRKETSQKFALKNNLPVLNNVSLPRVGALKAIMDEIGPKKQSNNNKSNNIEPEKKSVPELRWILDITIAYPGGDPLDLTTILHGLRKPCKTVLYYRLYPSHEVPDNPEQQTQWLYDRFCEKEKLLENFYKTGSFTAGSTKHRKEVVTQDMLRFIIIHIFFITSTYFHMRMLYALCEYCSYYIY
ncbi:acyl-CoA:lysophosphatidylglycerol acyltransferase 1-like [Ctenocephalides felis]|uniref:acyl-CoA:lysophosphatidylglycerol acyltransferase 1-like n=1 Tax=Ctenocephalides felis TaxID=7515 RepID=UPI000E6E33DB|nr:acyl-CoA:lysophosphatidylglycerol acyltransferase 1-like [Ctenocephalides felis]